MSRSRANLRRVVRRVLSSAEGRVATLQVQKVRKNGRPRCNYQDGGVRFRKIAERKVSKRFIYEQVTLS